MQKIPFTISIEINTAKATDQFYLKRITIPFPNYKHLNEGFVFTRAMNIRNNLQKHNMRYYYYRGKRDS